METSGQFWARRLRWRLIGAWRWPLFFVCTLADALIVRALPPFGGRALPRASFHSDQAGSPSSASKRTPVQSPKSTSSSPSAICTLSSCASAIARAV